ncbi:MAG TPA: ankyrin repeat domain-containing protein [Methylotenera sp.]|nr:ankyrin repeat domain-containing protein [Methylotenera sp.]HPH05154.1 ankyrin repeat domain-containing protein [Methylotenera sp.]HPN00518.1 ankyrin repeat domain-containing protein [Methylotenera sp.]
MKWLSALLAVLALSFSLQSHAVTDDESLEFVNAITEGDIKVVKKFVEADPANANYKSFAWSPLQMAANKGQIEVATYLISKGAELDYIHPLSKNTAFHLAAFGNFKDMATLLAKSGADVNKKLKANVSLLRPFQDADNKQMIEFLTGLGVKDDGCKEQKCFEEPD